MSIESDLRAALLANANVSSLVSTRIYPNVIPQSATLPAIAYQSIDAPVRKTLGGVLMSNDQRIQIRLVAETYAEIVQMVSAVRELDRTSQGDINYIRIEEGPDGYDFETKLYTRVVDAICR